MEDFEDSNDEYELAIRNRKRKKSESRSKTEEKYIEHNQKIFIKCKDKNKLNSNNLILQKIGNNTGNTITENNNETDFLNIPFRNPKNKSSNVIPTNILGEYRNNNNEINNEISNKISLIFNKKSDNKIFPLNENIRKHKESKTSKFSNFDINFSKEIAINNIHGNNDFKNYNDQKILISPDDYYKNIIKTNQTFSNNNIKTNTRDNNTNIYLNTDKIINNSEKINLKKLNIDKRKYYFSDEEDGNEEEEDSYEEIKKEYNYASSSGSEGEDKKEKENEYSKTEFKIIHKKEKSVNYNRNNNKKSLINDNKNNKINIKNNIKNYKKSVDIKNLRKNNININDYFKYRYNMYNSSVCTLAKDIDGEQCPNEDSYLIKENIFDLNLNIYGIFDGHGKDSHKISKNIAENMGKFFSSKRNYQNFLDRLIKITHESNVNNSDCEIEQNDENPEIPLNINTIYKLFNENNFYFIKRSVRYCENKLRDKKYNLKFAGSTCVMLFLFNDKLICSNIGDSRCVLFKCTQKKRWSYISLSRDDKPANEEEKKRIRNNGGEVHPSIDENGNYEDNIQRVWVKNKLYPGLALSRSIGDLVARKVGIISIPTFICKKIDNRSKFIILGSDGFWDVIGFSEIINIVKPYLEFGNPETVAKILVEKAKKAWSKFGERDDITVIVIFISADLTAKYETNMNVRMSGEDS